MKKVKKKKNQLKIVIFTAVKNCCIIAWACFRNDVGPHLSIEHTTSCKAKAMKANVIVFYFVTALFMNVFENSGALTFYDINLHLNVIHITKTCPCNIQRFFTAVKMKKKNNFLIFAQNIDCGYTLEAPQ